MGTDIHGVFQRRTPEGWRDVPSTQPEGRHYQLFAVLAGVRNGVGFAGVPTGDAVTPISQPRGLPVDFELVNEAHPASRDVWDRRPTSRYWEPGDEGYGSVWMGDHSHSWLTGQEMLEWRKRAPVVTHTGIITAEQFATWQKGTDPDDYCGGISGPRVVVGDQTVVENTPPPDRKFTHVRVRWNVKLSNELAYFFDEVERLVKEHGAVRFVFGFDS